MTERRGTYDLGGRVAALRDSRPENDRLESVAIAFALALAWARVAGGLVEVLFPKLFLRVFGHLGSGTDGAALGFRMKGGRDLGVGVLTLGAALSGDRAGVAQLTATGVFIDAIDGLAVQRDQGRTLRRPLHPSGAWIGYGVALGAAAAAWTLGRE